MRAKVTRRSATQNCTAVYRALRRAGTFSNKTTQRITTAGQTEISEYTMVANRVSGVRDNTKTNFKGRSSAAIRTKKIVLIFCSVF